MHGQISKVTQALHKALHKALPAHNKPYKVICNNVSAVFIAWTL